MVMLIVGGKNSSNTKKLYELSKKICPNTFLIENYKEIPYNYIDKNTIVGVSAGASAPDWIIEEVISMLENLNNNMNEMNEEAEQAIEKTEKSSMHELLENYGGVSYIRTGEKVKGTVIYVRPDAVSVNINYKVIKEGDEIEAIVVRISDQDGNVVLTRKPMEEQKTWEELELMRVQGTIVDTHIVEASQYGIYGKVNGIKGFIPRNQISVNRNVDPSEFVGKSLKVKILETKNKKGRRQLVLTSRAVEKIEKEAKDLEVWETIQEGEVYEGTVKNIQDYGAFVEINGIDGLLHINEIAWTRIKHPSEVLKTGDKIDVKVKSIDKENRRLSLIFR
jgi:4-hydroxy-3-methylbut-2-enyl diphosphate reductase